MNNKQISLFSLTDGFSKVKTNKKVFLARIEKLIQWNKFISMIKLHHYNGEHGSNPYNLELYIFQNLYNPSDTGKVSKV